MLLENEAFKEFAKLSTHYEPTRKWFENIILGKVEDYFSNLCVNINQKLLELLAEAGEAKCKESQSRKSKTKGDSGKKMAMTTKTSNVSYQTSVFQLAQHDNLNGIICNDLPLAEGERVGIVALIQVLSMEMETKLVTGLKRHAVQHRNNNSNCTEDDNEKYPLIQQM